MRLFVVLLAACGGQPAPEPAPAVDAAAVLAKADAHDGTVDHVVSECAVCGLAMEGDPMQSVTVGAYEVHLCSESCKTHMEGHTDEVIANLDRLLD